MVGWLRLFRSLCSKSPTCTDVQHKSRNFICPRRASRARRLLLLLLLLLTHASHATHATHAACAARLPPGQE